MLIVCEVLPWAVGAGLTGQPGAAGMAETGPPFEGRVLFREDFSTLPRPGYYRHVANDQALYEAWEVAGACVAEGGERWARIDLSLPWVSSNPSARWDGGFMHFVRGLTNLPPRWVLSLRVRSSQPEPMRLWLKIIASTAGRQGPPWSGVKHRTLAAWVEPGGEGWQTIVAGSHTIWEEGWQSYTPPNAGLEIRLERHSHDAAGRPLALASPGSHWLDVDDLLIMEVGGPPRLSIEKSGSGNVRVRWPAVYSTGFHLEAAPDPVAGPWRVVEEPVAEDAGWQWVETVPVGLRFFRLRE